MKASAFFGIAQPQAVLDFVDVDVAGDVRLFVDPSALLPMDTEWAAECRHLIQHYFDTVLEAIRRDEHDRAIGLLAALREPNETHLGLSKGGRSRGRGLGPGLAERLWESLAQSPAVDSGALADLQDTCLMVEGVDKDLVSDIATNLIREPLIRYTQAVCAAYEIPTVMLDSGPLWQPNLMQWVSRLEELPAGPFGRLLFVPKTLVRQTLTFNADEYYRHYLLTHMQGVHLEANSSLVTVLKNGDRVVYKYRLEERYGTGKRAAAQLTVDNPGALEKYRRDKRRKPDPPLDDAALASVVGAPDTDWAALLETVTSVPTGTRDATRYHHAIRDLLSALLAPSLAFPETEAEILSGRKRIDLLFTNTAIDGFFAWVRENYTAPYVIVECKNYAGDPANPALDQLSGRFSTRRGRVGILCCRAFVNRELFLQRCRDTADDDRGYVLALDDDDLRELVSARRNASTAAERERLLRERFDRLVL